MFGTIQVLFLDVPVKKNCLVYWGPYLAPLLSGIEMMSLEQSPYTPESPWVIQELLQISVRDVSMLGLGPEAGAPSPETAWLKSKTKRRKPGTRNARP